MFNFLFFNPFVVLAVIMIIIINIIIKILIIIIIFFVLFQMLRLLSCWFNFNHIFFLQ